MKSQDSELAIRCGVDVFQLEAQARMSKTWPGEVCMGCGSR